MLEPAGQLVTKRALLGAVASSWLLAACGRARPTAATSRTSASTIESPFPILIPGLSPPDLASLVAFAPGLDPIPLPTGVPSAAEMSASGAKWQVIPALPFLLPAAGSYAPVDPAIRQLNFQPSTLVAGAFAAFAGGDGAHYGMPAYGGPWGVQYDRQVFQQLNLAPPAPGWTIGDFEDACAAIGAGIANGDLPHLQAPLPPLVGEYTLATGGPTKDPAAPQLPGFGEFNDADLWGAFIQGFGGTAVSNGRFDLTNSGAVAGLQRMVDIAARYAPPPSTPPVVGAYAMAFSATASFGGAGPSIVPLRGSLDWARFPVLPVSPVIPFKVAGFSVASTAEGRVLFETTGGSPPGTPTGALMAVVEYAMWYYGQNHAASTSAPPVLASAQAGFWGAHARPAGYASVGDWRHFRVVEAGWPVVPNQNPSNISYVGEKVSPVYAALTQAVTNKVPVASLLSEVSAQLNAMVSTPAAAK